jgi:hypothetical protein
MAIKLDGKLLNVGWICNDGPYSSGLKHGVINGEILCNSGLNFGSRYLHAKELSKIRFNSFLDIIDCKKCKVEINKRWESAKSSQS